MVRHLPRSAVVKIMGKNGCEYASHSAWHTGGKKHNSDAAILISSLKGSDNAYKSQNLYLHKFVFSFCINFYSEVPICQIGTK